ncbi:MAG: aminotransferase class I/II-fold pyridoxal phosphate-dependent enzyme [Emcibacter sp.]|nr:aminotransferase class I/II-fold pyridoxal phosphate-dependent enzyme [Emcibacter sp.]MBL4893358.1 aminotransferase class I/II-fold pyridoxal phosphate-dependent enzyme [Emcibacter sp.]
MKHGGDPGLLYPHMKRPWIDLSTGINPWGYPWMERMDAQDIFLASSRLPTAADYGRCQNAYARYLGGEAGDITLAPGSQALIECLPTLFEKQTVYIAGPTYSEHEICWRRAGHDVRIFQDMADLDSIKPDVIVIFCAPNNPDGQHPDIINFMHRHTATGGYVIIDEAFADLTPERSLIGPDLPKNVIILRSFGKFFGLAGVRIGVAYTKGPIKIPSGLWHISTLSLLIAARALSDPDWIIQTRKMLAEKMAKLTKIFQEKGHKIIGQTDLFCLVQGPDKDKILRAGIFARSFKDRPGILRFGLPPTEQDFQKLKEQL